MLKDVADKYYFSENYNCAETIIRAANEYYDLGLHERDMTLVAGFGAGMQTAGTCGTLLSAISVLSMKFVETRAHESRDIQPVTALLIRRFQEQFQSTLCREIKPRYFQKDRRCQNTVHAACDVLEAVLAEYQPKEKRERVQ